MVSGAQITCAPPTGLVENHVDVLVPPDRVCEALEQLLRCLGDGARHNEGEAVVSAGFDRRGDVGEREALVEQPGGRSPRRQQWHVLRFWPMRPSSWKRPDAFVLAEFLRSTGALFKGPVRPNPLAGGWASTSVGTAPAGVGRGLSTRRAGSCRIDPGRFELGRVVN
jgi:hypothetical protein